MNIIQYLNNTYKELQNSAHRMQNEKRNIMQEQTYKNREWIDDDSRSEG